VKALIAFVFDVQTPPAVVEFSLPASEGTTGRGDSVLMPVTRKGEFNAPVGVFNTAKFGPITLNTQIGGRAGVCIDTGVRLPPELGDVETCRAGNSPGT
jgi:hypothetical protein